MGLNPLSWFGRRTDINKVFNELDAKIRTADDQLIEYRVNKRQYKFNFMYYTIPTYIVYVAYYFCSLYFNHFYMSPESFYDELHHDNETKVWNWSLNPFSHMSFAGKVRFVKFLILVLTPFFIIMVTRLIEFYYNFRIKHITEKQRKLKLEMAKKLEELKRATQYYSTFDLIKRYEEPYHLDSLRSQSSVSPEGKKTGKVVESQNGELVGKKIDAGLTNGSVPDGNQETYTASTVEITQEFPSTYQSDLNTNPFGTNSYSTGVSNGPSQNGLVNRNDPAYQQQVPLEAMSSSSMENMIEQQEAFLKSTNQFVELQKSQQKKSSSGSKNESKEKKGYFDKFLDALVGGEENPANQYALVCVNCYTHNGLASSETNGFVEFTCAKCKFINIPQQRNDGSLTYIAYPPLEIDPTGQDAQQVAEYEINPTVTEPEEKDVPEPTKKTVTLEMEETKKKPVEETKTVEELELDEEESQESQESKENDNEEGSEKNDQGSVEGSPVSARTRRKTTKKTKIVKEVIA